MNLDRLNKYYEDGWLIKQTHPELPLTIWNYSQSTQFERMWDEITLQCRGLVTDDEGNVVAHPFRKFFNIEEGMHTPTKDFRVYEKMDGSLIIVFNYMDNWVVASRGSFTSDQAIAADKLLRTKYNMDELDESFTYLFEFTAPWNRIVVDYGSEEQLTCLGIMDDSGEVMREFVGAFMLNTGIPVVKEYDNMDEYELLKEIIHDNQEGFVIHFSNGDRCKIKGEEYIRLHRIMTNASTTSVWDVLRNGDSMEEYLKEVPDEFYQKIKEFKESLEDSYWEVANKTKSIFKSLYREGMEVKEFADKVKYLQQPYKALLFSQFNLKMGSYSECIWNSIKPEFRKL